MNVIDIGYNTVVPAWLQIRITQRYLKKNSYLGSIPRYFYLTSFRESLELYILIFFNLFKNPNVQPWLASEDLDGEGILNLAPFC